MAQPDERWPFEPRPTPAHAPTKRAGGDPGRPRFRRELHRPHGGGHLDRRRRLARLGRRAVRAVRARPGDGGAALRPGDLRGAEGLPARRRQRLAVPAREERRADCPLRPAAGAAGAAAGGLPRQHRGAGGRRRRAGCPRAAEQSLYLRPFMFASEAFLGVRAGASGSPTAASPARPGPTSPRACTRSSIWISTTYTRAAPGGTGAAKCGGNYAASLIAQQEAAEHGCDQVMFADAAEHPGWRSWAG